MDENCIFCKIIAGKIPTLKVYEDKDVMAFLDIAPANKGHTLIVPKKHSKDMLEDNNKDLAAVMKAASAEGFNFIANTGPVAGQVVFHTHFHIIPRFENDGLKHWPKKDYSEDEMIAVKNKIIESI